MRVLLVYPNANKKVVSWGDAGAIAEPIALEYLGAVARSEGHEVRLLDLRLHNDALADTLAAFRPDLVGLTGYSMHVLRCLEVCRLAKELVPGCKTAVGGHHATLEPVDFFEPEVDYVVVGEGSRPFRAILAECEEQADRSSIPGTYSQVDGVFRYGGAPQPFDFAVIPEPDRTLALEDRKDYYIDWMRPIAMIRTSIGCPFRCSFCSLWRIMGGRYHTRDLDSVVSELGTIAERHVFLTDDEPFINAKRMFLLADKIERSGIEKEYFGYCRVDSMLKHADLIKRWRQIGMKRFLLGVETIFDGESSGYRKRQKREQVERGLQLAAELDIHLMCNFIIHPDYSDKQFDELIHFIEENKVEHPSFTIWTPLPGTGYADESIVVRQPNGRPNWDYFDLQHPVTATRLPKKEFVARYFNLYMRFLSKYYASDGPMTVALMQRMLQGVLHKAVPELAAKAMEGDTPPVGHE
ncbi:MAG: B12-binding domain-containing radical SAM protein [Desulfobacteraceae bacterium]|nr:B12-binding domain-containing radical SAM protein [Desulfobacteraceae bacterium]